MWVAGSCVYLNSQIIRQIPEQLQHRNLQINKDRTEQYTIRKNGPKDWKKSKYLGKALGTLEDIKKRKGLAYIKKYITNKNSSVTNIIRRFEAFISTTFLYNSELWTLSKRNWCTAKDISKNMFRSNRKWQNIKQRPLQKNENKIMEWNHKRNKNPFLGHLPRLPLETPAKSVLNESQAYTKISWKTSRHMVEKNKARPQRNR